jgi:Zn-dependent protease with chaperone function
MRMRFLAAAVFCITLLSTPRARASETPAEHAANVYAAQEMASHPVNGNLPDYSLSPADLAKAQHLQTTGTLLNFTGTVWSIVQVLLLLSFGVIAWIRDTTLRTTRVRFLQAFIFFGLFSLAGFILDLPLSLYGHHLSLSYGLSIQHWGSWFWDETKSFLIGWIVGGLLVLLLFWIIRKFPLRWWLVFWACSIPIVFLAIFVSPYINFLFNKYEPLQQSNPALVAKLEQIVAKGHMDIPPERMFLMKASEKVTTLNADVEGFGASKRVVVWDNTISKMKPDEVLGVFGHESGHYVLGHIRQGVFEAFIIIFVILWLAYLFIAWTIARFGERWRIPSQSDWGAFAVLTLAFGLCSILLQPLTNTLTRSKEHAADVYGQEAIHGIVADPQASMQGAFVVLGTNSYAVPNLSPFVEFWFGSHPAIGRRAAFAKVYDPWAPGMQPKYFQRDIRPEDIRH